MLIILLFSYLFYCVLAFLFVFTFVQWEWEDNIDPIINWIGYCYKSERFKSFLFNQLFRERIIGNNSPINFGIPKIPKNCSGIFLRFGNFTNNWIFWEFPRCLGVWIISQTKARIFLFCIGNFKVFQIFKNNCAFFSISLEDLHFFKTKHSKIQIHKVTKSIRNDP